MIGVLAATVAASFTARTTVAQTSSDAWEGPYTPIPMHANPSHPSQHCCEIAHAILIAKPGPAQGHVLLIQSSSDRWLWDPAAPNSVSADAVCDNTIDNVFCSGHSADGEGNIVVHAGNRVKTNNPAYCGPQPTWSYVFNPTDMCWNGSFSLLIPTPTPQNFGYWYPGSVRLHDGRVLSAGGGSAPLNVQIPPVPPCFDQGNYYFVNGWQIFDPVQGAWFGSGPGQWFAGLPGGTNYEFNYYPLLCLIPSSPPYPSSSPGYVFASTVTNSRTQNNGPTYVPKPSPSGLMDLGVTNWPTAGQWSVHASQISVPGTAVPRNLLYPNGIVRPLVLDNQGMPMGPVEVMVFSGADRNEPDVFDNSTPQTAMLYGRPALRQVSQISAPEQPGAMWSYNGARFPDFTYERIYSNAVVLPTGELFLVGGSSYDFYPFGGGAPGTPGSGVERIADPVYVPEMIDLFAANPLWQPCVPHFSPRLYHSTALLLRDGRVLVAGGYQGVKFDPMQQSGPLIPAEFNWSNFTHSDFEIFSPDYLFAGARPQIAGFLGGGNTIDFGTPFEIKVYRPGSTTPALDISSVCLISPGSVTHHYDWDQRYVGLHFAPSATAPNTNLVITPPANGHVAPPGWYMLFVNTGLNATPKIPSIGMFVKLQ